MKYLRTVHHEGVKYVAIADVVSWFESIAEKKRQLDRPDSEIGTVEVMTGEMLALELGVVPRQEGV